MPEQGHCITPNKAGLVCVAPSSNGEAQCFPTHNCAARSPCFSGWLKGGGPPHVARVGRRP
eukprot:15443832-Alexandrium_andersonii.AAC.1